MSTTTEYRAAYFLPHLHLSLRGESTEMVRLEQTLSQVLTDARVLGEPHVSETHRARWHELWSEVQATTEALRDAMTEIRGRIDASRSVPLSASPSKPGEAHPRRLTELFPPLRALAAQDLPQEEQDHWNDLWHIIESATACIRVHLESVQVQLQLRQKYRTQKSLIAEDVVVHGPPHANLSEVTKFGEDYRQAVQEMQKERQQSGDFQDILKAMFMYVEAPEERVRNKHRAEIEEPVPQD